MQLGMTRQVFCAVLWGIAFLMSWVALNVTVEAQLPTATVSGVVKDASGAVIPGVQMAVTNTDTGLSRTGTTAADGSYKFPALPVGTYELKAEHPGFQREIQSGLRLSIGQEAVIHFTLQVGAVEQTVAVTAEAPMIETTSGNVAGLISEDQLRDLPLNARNLIELATLYPGVTIAREAGQGVPNGFATKLAITGTRYNSSLFQLDGADINDGTGSAGGAAGILMGVETVREFSVVTSGYSAEYGKHSGGVFNAVTKSGTNSLHGSVFEFLRNDKLDAARWEDNALLGGKKPPYKRNQYGFSLGGPILRDKTFFFGSYESLRERTGRTQTFTVPNADARRGVLANPTGPTQTIEVNAAIQPFLNSYPLPNGRDFGNGTGDFARDLTLPTDEHFFTVRLDHTFSSKDSLFVRYTFDDADRLGSSNFNANTLNTTRSQYAALSETRLLTPQVINVFLMGYNRSILGADPSLIDGFTFPSKSFTDRVGPIGNISVTGVAGWGASATTPTKSLLNQYQFKDDIFYTTGSHSFKFGFNAQRMQYLRSTYFNGGGQFSFTSLANFLRGTVNRFTGMPRGSDPSAYPRQTLYGMYVQDDIRLTPRLTLNLGIRYEFVTTPNVLNGRISNLHRYLTPGQTEADLVLGNPFFLNPSLKNFAPRVGFAWDPTGSGKTSIRGGVGIFYDQVLPGPFLFSYVSTPPFYRNADIFAASTPRFPDAWYIQQNLLLGQSQSEPFQYKAEQPTVYKFSLDIQRAITQSTSLEVGFTGTRGVHLFRALLTNMPVAQEVNGRIAIPNTAPLLNPGFGRIRPKQSDSTSDYYGLRLGFNQRMVHGLMFRGSYTWSKVIDDGSNFAGALDFDNSPSAPRYLAIKDRGLSSFDVRNALSVSVTYDLPGDALTGVSQKLLGGWQTSAILSLQEGTPFTASTGILPSWMNTGFVGDYPDLVGEIRYDTRNPDRYFDPAAFANPPNTPTLGFVGNASRNPLIGPGIAQFNFVLTKSISLTERVNLRFRSEFHNLFNRANFGRPSGTIFDARTGAISPTVGRITDTDTTSRQIQFSLKVEF